MNGILFLKIPKYSVPGSEITLWHCVGNATEQQVTLPLQETSNFKINAYQWGVRINRGLKEMFEWVQIIGNMTLLCETVGSKLRANILRLKANLRVTVVPTIS